jgi:hypothetical protein
MSWGSVKQPAALARTPPSLFAPNLDLLETLIDKNEPSTRTSDRSRNGSRTRGSPAASTTGRPRISTNTKEQSPSCRSSVTGDSRTQPDCGPVQFSSPPTSPRRQPKTKTTSQNPRLEPPSLSCEARHRKEGDEKVKPAAATAAVQNNNDQETMIVQHASSLPQSNNAVFVPPSPPPPTPSSGDARKSSMNPAHIDIVVHCPWPR